MFAQQVSTKFGDIKNERLEKIEDIGEVCKLAFEG